MQRTTAKAGSPPTFFRGRTAQIGFTRAARACKADA